MYSCTRFFRLPPGCASAPVQSSVSGIFHTLPSHSARMRRMAHAHAHLSGLATRSGAMADKHVHMKCAQPARAERRGSAKSLASAGAGSEPEEDAAPAGLRGKSLIKSVREEAVRDGVAYTIDAFSLSSRMDDPIYERYREVWERQPRGYSEVRLADGTLVHSMCGMRKFGYVDKTCYGDALSVRR